MAYNIKDVFYLDGEAITTTGAGDFATDIDVSSYVQPVARKGQKATGIAVYKVHWDVYDDATNDVVPGITTGAFRAGVFSDLGVPAGAVGSATIAVDNLRVANNLAISIIDWWGVIGAGAAGVQMPQQITRLEPSKDVPYVVVRDTIQLCGSISIATSNSCNVNVRLECAQVTLDMATLNQLLRTQTV